MPSIRAPTILMFHSIIGAPSEFSKTVTKGVIRRRLATRRPAPSKVVCHTRRERKCKNPPPNTVKFASRRCSTTMIRPAGDSRDARPDISSMRRRSRRTSWRQKIAKSGNCGDTWENPCHTLVHGAEFPVMCRADAGCLGLWAAGQGAGAARDAAGTEPRHVLVLLSYHHGHSWEDDILRGFSVWDGPPAQRPVLHIEWMDTKRYPSAQYRQRYQKFLDEKYAGRNFDLLVTVDDLALIQAVDSPAWRNTPIVFSGINGDPVALVGQRGRATGIAERYEVGHTLAMALALHQHTRRLVFLTAADESGVGNRETIGRALAELPAETKARLTIEHWTPTSLDKVDSQLSALSDGSLLFALGSLPVTESGRPLSNEQLVAYVRGKTQRPVYSDTDRSVGEGAVGGYVNSGFENGRLMAKMARRILAGEDAESLPYCLKPPRFCWSISMN